MLSNSAPNPPSKSKTMLLIDGSSFIFRAYHALPELTSPAGKPTGATRGIISMIKSMQKKYPTPYWGCIFDAPGKTFRDEIHPQYKATRKSTPDDLVMQLEDIYGIIRALGIPLIMQPGIEADDIIGTLAIQAKNAGYKVLIATGDKDFAQLVDEDITLINTMTNEVLDIQGVINKFEVKPSQIIDYLSLVGDKVDNIPGVDKCGPKTAAKWLAEHNTLDNIVSNAVNIGGVVGENLRKAIPWLKIAKILVTIDTNIELDHDNHIANINELICKPANCEILHTYYSTLGFKTWLEQLNNQTQIIPADINPTAELFPTTTEEITLTDLSDTRLTPDILNHNSSTNAQFIQINNYSELELLIKNLIEDKQNIGLLVVADNYYTPQNIKIIVIATSQNVYLIHNETQNDNNDLFTENVIAHNYHPLINKLFLSSIGKILPNAKETLQLTTKLKLGLNNIMGDLTLAHYICDSKHKHNLATIFKQHLNLEITDLPIMNTKLNKDSLWLNSNFDLIAQNCYIIAQYTAALENKICAKLTAAELKLYQKVELPLSQVLVDIETTGIMLDVSRFKELNNEITTKLAKLEEKIYQEAKCVFNINSTKQLQDILFNQLKLPTSGIKTNSHGFSTDEDTLQVLAAQNIFIATCMLEYRTLSKLLNTYVAKLPLLIDHNQRVHTTFDQALVASGRLSSKDPNLQNIPVKNDWGRQIRRCFIAPIDKKLICADYSQIELRILAHISGDENLITAFNNNADIHSITASEIFNKPIEQITKDERRHAKTINFSLLYGKTVFGLAQDLKIDRATAKLYIDTYFAKYPKILNCLENIKNFGRTNGFVETVLGRRIYLPNINASNKMLREAEERLALNAPMQGTSADIIKLAMLNIDTWLKKEHLHSKMVLQIHDELILEVPDSEVELVKANLAQLMTNVVNLSVKMAVDVKVAQNWDAAH
ncbi:MAG: DNA polymerase I [Burkholderiales bacterium]|nr:DNA polymerase I [Burkholderiales bacterium]